jgi:uncharacterized protein (DUF2141 family)
MTKPTNKTRTIAARRLRIFVIAASSLAAVVAAAAPARDGGVLTMRLALRNSRGQVGCLLFGSPRGFPQDPSAALQRKWCAIASAQSLCAFEAVPAGTYAVACFHDENQNGALDTGVFGIPKEGTAASNDAKGFMGPPRFDDAKFAFTGRPTELRLLVRY